MLEILTGSGLAVAAGLNAYVPLLVLGLGGRFLQFVHLPDQWAWLSNPWVLAILGVLLVIEIVADKIPVVDSINDWIQTIVRPVAGGIAFGTGSTSGTAVVKDPAEFFTSFAWLPVAVGLLLALATHLTKMASRPVMNVATVGAAAPVVSTAEDLGSVILSFVALLVPVLVIFAIIGVIIGFTLLFRRKFRKRRDVAEAPFPF